MFRKYHYLNHSLNKSSRQWIGVYNDRPIAFYAALPMPHGQIRNAWRGTRCVVLPDFQGIGLGAKMYEFCNDILLSEGKKVYGRTSHPILIHHRQRSHKWRLVGSGRGHMFTSRGGTMSAKNASFNKTRSSRRITTSWQYIGDK